MERRTPRAQGATSRLALLCALLGAACASTYDRELAQERRRGLYPHARVDEPERELRSPAPFAGGDLAAHLAYGLEHSARLRAAFELWHAALERVEQVSTLPEPRLTYAEFLEQVQTRTGPQQRRFGLSQPFPWPGERAARARVADEHAEALWYAVEAERLAVERDIELAYHEYGFLGRELRVKGELLELLRGLEPVVQSRVRSGGGQQDLLRLQVEIGRLEDDLASLDERRPSRWARLADAMNLQGWGAVPALPELESPATREAHADTLYAAALAANPGLRRLEREQQASALAVDVAGFQRRPSLAAGVEYIVTGDALNPGIAGSGDDPLALSLSLSLPVWSSSYAAAEREARHRARAARRRIDAAVSSLRVEVEEQVYRVNDAARRIELYETSLLPRADEALRLTQSAYRTGGASVLDVIDSERALLEFDLSFWRACRDYLQGRARLAALTAGQAGGASR